MIASLLFIFGATIAFAKLLEVLLSPKAEQQLLNAILRVWIFLADMRKYNTLSWLKYPFARFVITSCATAYTFHRFLLRDDLPGSAGFRAALIATFVITVVLIISFGSRFVDYLWTPQRRGLRLFTAAFLPIAPLLVLILIPPLHAVPRPYWYFYLVVFLTASSISGTLAIIWFMAVVPVVLSNAGRAILAFIEFLLRRIAEYPKGPVLAISAISVGTATLLKLLE